MTTEILKFDNQELNVIEESKAKQIKETFEPMAKMLAEFEEVYNTIVNEASNEVTKEVTEKAKRLRLDIGKVRIETGKIKDKQKEYINLEGKAIMGVHNVLIWAVKEKEDKLKEIENYFEIQEQKRLESLQSHRVDELSKYVEDAHERQLSGMEEDVWMAYFGTKKKEYKDRVAAEKKAKAERIEKEKAEAKERQRIRAENEQLKKDAEERDLLARIESDERAKVEQQRKAKEDAERKIRDERERKDRAEFESKLKAEREEKARIEREEKAKREKLEAELKAKEDAEHRAKEEESARLQTELNKGDLAKVKDLIIALELLKSKYSFKSAKNKKMYTDVCTLIDRVINHINFNA